MQFLFLVFVALPFGIGKNLDSSTLLSEGRHDPAQFRSYISQKSNAEHDDSSFSSNLLLYSNKKHSFRDSSKQKREVAINAPQSNFTHFKHLGSNTIHSSKEILTTHNENFKIEVSPSISAVFSSSVTINLKTNIVMEEDEGTNKTEDIGVKLLYRPFGSVVKKEMVIGLIDTTLKNFTQVNEQFNKSFIVDNLHSNTGYIFCFSLMNNDNNGKSIYDKSSNNFTHINRSTTKRYVEEVSIPDSTTITSTISSSNHMSSVHSPVKSQSKSAIFDRTNVDSLKESNASDLYESTITTSLLSNYPPRPSRTNYAYSSTGELIYLPISSWRPGNNRRSRSERSTSQESRYCLEIKTNTSDEHVSLFIPLIISSCLLGFGFVVLILVIIYGNIFRKSCAHRCKKEGNLKVDDKVEIKSPTIQMTENSKQSPNELQMEGNKSININTKNDAQSDILSISELNATTAHTITKTNQYCKRTYFKKPMPLNLKNINKELDDFHPGYDLPPSSTVEVYGYDFPRKLDNRSWSLNSPASSSCELNDSASYSSYDNMSDKYNLNKPRVLNKRSEAMKYVISPDLISQMHNTKHKTDSSETKISLENFNLFQSESCNDTDKVESNESKISSSLTKNLQQVRKSKTFPSVGDITISGGTLIEVPEGYVHPKPNPKPVNRSVTKINIKLDDMQACCSNIQV